MDQFIKEGLNAKFDKKMIQRNQELDLLEPDKKKLYLTLSIPISEMQGLDKLTLLK